jgi:hypothetical protein
MRGGRISDVGSACHSNSGGRAPNVTDSGRGVLAIQMKEEAKPLSPFGKFRKDTATAIITSHEFVELVS